MHDYFTDDDLAALPPLYGTEGQGMTALCRVRLFLPGTYWVWYAVEYSPDDNLCFGLVAGHDVEIGYFSLDELAESGLPVLRDPRFAPVTLAEAQARHDAERAGLAMVDFTTVEPDEERGGAFGICPACGRTGRIVDFPAGGRHYLHTAPLDAPYAPADRCRIHPGETTKLTP